MRPDDSQAFASRRHFFAAAATAKRARRQRRQVHGGGRRREELHPDLAAAPQPDDDLVALDAALVKLAERDLAKARLVELHYFAGLSAAQAAAMLGISPSIADRHWVYAQPGCARECKAPRPAKKSLKNSWCCGRHSVA